ncbi:MAG: hypothetical protein ABI999_01650 [Acidobacteriota bacterium]
MKSSVMLLLLSFLMCSWSADAQDKWQVADQQTLRLSPRAFPKLPGNILAYVQAKRCTIPQIYGEQKPHNVIRGNFARDKQHDWAVLCSRHGVSAILIFWNSSIKSVSEIERSADKDFLQEIDGSGNVGFSRSIGVVGRAYIMQHYRWYGGRKPPKITHQGIDDGFVEKASSILYFYSGRWLTLSGAD